MPKYRKVFEEALEKGQISINQVMHDIRREDPEYLKFAYGPELGRPLHLLSDSIRAFLWAAPGYEFICADYGSIEGRMSAWFAKEEWKLKAFRDYDAGNGFGMYELTAAQIYNIAPAEVDKQKRQVGKVAELALGYMGGVGALARMARQNKLKLHKVYGPVWESASPERREAALKRLEERTTKKDEYVEALGKEGWLTAEIVKVGWRAAHPCIAEGWRLLEDAATAAVLNPGSIHTALGVKYLVKHGFLIALLPSGRPLFYGAPRIEETTAPWADMTLAPDDREKKLSLTAMGVDSQTGYWRRHSIYGGSLFNNVVQGSARDILYHGMHKAEAAGYPVVLDTHDEIAAEVIAGWGDVKEFEDIICQLPPWAAGLPLVASGWRGKRYRK